ncbi:MAG: hypothetical protein EOP09_11405, partial [Proteobacteria bacterium]
MNKNLALTWLSGFAILTSQVALTSAQAASEVPAFKLMCKEVFFPKSEEIHKMKFEETVFVAKGSGGAHAVWSKSNLNSHSNYNYLIRRSNKDENPTADHFNKGIRLRNPVSGGQVGWGVIEQTWSHLHENVATFTQVLYESNREQFSGDEHVMVQKIIAAMHMKQDIKFISEKSKPGFFQQTGPHRVAVTGSVPGSTIYVNDKHTQIFQISKSDEKWTNDTGLGDPHRIETAGLAKDKDAIVNSTKKDLMANLMGLLVHEFGHHVGLKDTADRPLDQ